MTSSNIKARIPADVQAVWDTVLNVEQYAAWCSDLARTETVNEKQFVADLKKALNQ